jgi:hypothetical protein
MFDMALDDSETRFAALYYSAGNGTGESAICLYDIGPGGGKKLDTVLLQGEFPLKCSFVEGGGLVVITNRSLRVYDEDLDETSAYGFGEAAICAFDANSNGTVAVVSTGTQKNVLALDGEGDKIFSGTIGENISAESTYGDFIFLRTVTGVIRIDTSNGEREFLPSDSGKMPIYGEDTAIVCGDAKAEYLVFDYK